MNEYLNDTKMLISQFNNLGEMVGAIQNRHLIQYMNELI